MIRGLRTFKEFQASDEGIATNILANRLHRLEAAGIVQVTPDASDARKLNYRLTQKGIDLAPVLLELFVWGARHEDAGVPCSAMELMANSREQVLAEVRRRWQENDLTPLLPKFDDKVRSNAKRKAKKGKG